MHPTRINNNVELTNEQKIAWLRDNIGNWQLSDRINIWQLRETEKLGTSGYPFFSYGWTFQGVEKCENVFWTGAWDASLTLRTNREKWTKIVPAPTKLVSWIETQNKSQK